METGVIQNIVEGFMSIIPKEYSLIFVLLFFTAIITIYAVFVFYFYKFLAKKNIVILNLKRFNTSEHAVLEKFFASIFYVVEYLLALPVLTFVWFSVLAIFLLVLTKVLSIAAILTISAALVASVRITPYLSEDLSRDLAKMLPFTLLGLALTQPDFFSIELLFVRIAEIPSMLIQIPYYLLFIIAFELVMRVFDIFKRITVGSSSSDDIIETIE